MSESTSVAAAAAPAAAADTAADFKLLTFNVLADSLCRPAWFPYASPEALAWPARSRRIQQLVREHDADVICLQEIQSGRPASLYPVSA